MLFANDEEVHPEKNPLVRIARRLFPVSADFEGERFFTQVNGRQAITPLFLVLLVIESTDVLFAVDSIPAVFGVTEDPFIVFTSNVFAILNLRSLYFALAGLLEKFRHLKYSLVLVLAFVGVKMLIPKHVWHPETQFSLAFIGLLLLGGIVSSLIATRRDDGGDGGDGGGNVAAPALHEVQPVRGSEE
jgi:tellurite resistance protein TerC